MRAPERLFHLGLGLAGHRRALREGVSRRDVLPGKPEEWVELAIHNEGTAISPKELEAIFAPFHRADSAVSGTHSGWGVGLTLVKGIAEAHGGSTWVVSEAMGGTTFFVSLPLQGRPLS